MYKQIVGVYQIQSIIKPFRVYIGSGVNIHQRWSQHLQDLRADKHHSHKLQRHYNKYGESDLVFEIIESGEYIDKNHLLSREQGCFGRFEYKNTEMPYFNETPIAGSPLGIKRSPEFCKQVGDRARGKKTGRPAWNKGKKGCYSPESIKKRTESVLAFYKTDKGKLRCKHHSEIMKGIPKPDGFGERISKANHGETHHNFGKKQHPEVIDKRVAATRKTRLLKKQQQQLQENEQG